MSAPEYDVSIEMLTPEIASALLATNVRNRKVRPSHVAKLAREIDLDRWAFNGATIVIDTDGHLLDGQHRCMAVVEADKPVYTVFVKGVDPLAFATVDKGCARTAGDTLRLHGYKYAFIMAAVARFAWNLKSGGTGGKKRRKGISTYPTDADVLAFCKRNKTALVESCRFVTNHYTTKIFPSARAAYFHFLMAKKDRDKADAYWRGIYSGADLKTTSPMYYVREKLIADQMSNTRGFSRRGREDLVVLGWNAFRGGRTPKNIKIPSSRRARPEIE